MQRRTINVEKSLWLWRLGFKIVSMLPLQHPWYILRWTYCPTLRQRCNSVINLTLQCIYCEDVVNVTWWSNHCHDVINTTAIAYCGFNLPFKVHAVLEQHCNFDFKASTSRQPSVLVYKATAFPQRCHNVATTLRFCWAIWKFLKNNKK